MQGGRPPKRPAEGHSPAAQSPNPNELAAFRVLATKRQRQAAEERRPPVVAPEALIAMPALLPLFKGKKHSTFVVHADNPDPRCQPLSYVDDHGKEQTFPGRNGDHRVLPADYAPSNVMLSFFLGQENGSVWDSLNTVGGIQGLDSATKPSKHMALLGGVMRALGAGDLYRRWLFYLKADYKKAFLTLPAAGALPPPGYRAGATLEDNLLGVRKGLWAWAFNGEELPSEDEMQALGGPVKAEEMYELARKMWGVPEPAERPCH